MEISERRKEVKELGDNHSGLCELYYIKGDFEKAKFHGEEVMKHISYIHQDNNSILGKIYEKTGDYKRAYELLRTNWSDWEQTQKERRDYELIANLINEKFEGEIETLRKYKELQALTIRNQNYLVFIAFVLLLLFGLIGLFFWKQYQRCKALSESQKKIIEQEKKTNLVKTQFFSNVSHELRTPLTLITGNLNLISDNNDMQNDALTAIKKAKWQSQEMLSMLDNILVLTKNEMIAQEPKPRLFLLNDFTVYMNEKVSALAARKEILFETKNSIETSTIFTTDVEMLTTVVKNLLDNAFKYTQPGGKVTIDYQMEDKRLKISVLDSGRGIPDTDLPYIFDRYYQVSDQDKPQEGGFGIGLSICKEYVDAMGGSIAVDSVQGEYTRFTFWIPSIKAKVDQGNLYQFKIIKSPQIQVHASPKQADDIIDNEFILIAEDNLEMCDYLNTLLSKEYHVLFVHNGKEVLRILERHRPMLIITDLMMPVMDGMTMIEQLRNNKRHANIPIIILSAKDSVVDEIKAARFGVEEYLRKPFQEEKLQAHIYHLLHLDEQRSESLEEAPIEEDYIDHLKRSKLKTSKELVASVSDREWVKMVEEKISPLITDMNLNVDKICEVLEISPTHLTRQMKELIGMTPKRYVNELRLLMGRRMLENKEYNSVKAVAYSVGFNSDKVFSRNFKARFGKHPSAYLD